MEQARIEHAPNGSLLTYITSADAMVNKPHSNLLFCFIILFSFTHDVLMQDRVIETVEYRAVIMLLYLKGSTPNEALDEMKVVYGEDARHSLEWSVQVQAYIPIPGHPLSAIDNATPSCRLRPPFWRIVLQQSANKSMKSISVLGLWKI